MFKRTAIVTSIECLKRKEDLTVRDKVVAAKEVFSFEYDTENFVYFRCRAITADIPNGNGDLFPEAELVRAYKSFINVGMFMDHDSDSVDKSVGKVLWAEWIPEGKYVECICCVDKKLAPALARRIEMGEASTVSMGCMVGEAECGVVGCGNIAHNAMELCEHMIPGRGIKGKRGADGKVAYEINRLLQFTELSLVTVPADPTARIFEVYAAHRQGKITAEELKKLVGEEIEKMFGPVSDDKKALDKSQEVPITPGPVAASTAPANASQPAPGPKEVVKNKDSQEDRMKLAISYKRGPSLNSSYFMAKEAEAEFRVAASDVLPLLVQEAILKNEPGVATPEQIVSELETKCTVMADFKAWAKKRKKKNRRALEKLQLSKDEKPCDKPGEKPAEGTEEKKADTAAAPVMESPAAPAPASSTAPIDTPAVSTDPVTTPVEMANPAEAPLSPAVVPQSLEEIEKAIQDLQQMLDDKKKSSATAPRKTAVQVKENVVEHRDSGEAEGKPSPAKSPKAIQEVMKTENPKDHIDKGASTESDMQKKAINQDWSMNPKELDKSPKVPKPEHSMPSLMSVDSKEMKSEELKLDVGGKGGAGGKIKKFFGRLPSTGPGEAPKAMDLKSGQDPEKEMLRKALEEEKAKRTAIEDRQRLEALVNKIADIVAELLEKNLISAERQDETIKMLSASFKDMESLSNVQKLVSALVAKTAAAGETPATEGVEDGGAIPQVFETLTETEDAVNLMSRVWNQ